MKIQLIRHGMTIGNSYKRYIGRTDEPLSDAGRRALECAEKKDLETPDLLFVSPLIRCVQTADIFFPTIPQIVIPELAEMDFGIFENKSFQEGLSESPEYQKWVDSGCEDPIPEGESKQEFTDRCRKGFEKALTMIRQMDAEKDTAAIKSAAFVVHGGTIMSILSVFAEEQREYYDWYTTNGSGYRGEWENQQIKNIRKLL